MNFCCVLLLCPFLSYKVFMPIGKASNDEMKHLAARQTSLYFLLQVFKSSYNEKVILHNEKQEL